ncbi:low molecular weight protein-tyrosine-phosphatase [Aestuariimicrobium ganziense]|uniref:low molecular weight protein-tyrosine-phosphatase n=1 Tax=Aestuariimicrobium ganziense TaxID=2773677 RepID=UPI001940A12F|nr:low molecular weight protein-tyrosine-phosphatase [Aestuariimicrobium ganziense]
MPRSSLQFVCWGNICRSPMGEVMAKALADERGLDIDIDSTGVSAEESGNPLDRRARAVLERAGYQPGQHVARRITEQDIRNTTLLVAAEQIHVDRMLRLVPDATNIRLVTDFVPGATPGTPLPDPWYGGPEDFVDTLEVLEVAIPNILDEVSGSLG